MIQSQYDAARSASSTLPSPATTHSSRPVTPVSENGDSSSQSSATARSSSRSLVLPRLKGKDLFDSIIWKDPLTTSIFYTFIASLRKKIREDVKHTTPTHKFIRALRDSGKLVRCYTQNIDGLEARDGLCTDLSRGKGNRSRFMKRVVDKPRPAVPTLSGSEHDGGCEVVQLHGDLDVLRCTFCQKLFSWTEKNREGRLLSGQAPECSACVTHDEDRRSRGKRGTAVGTLRPNVILYGEEHPSAHSLSQITTHDIGLMPDALVILGTSLKVHGLKVLVKEFAKAVHARGNGKGRVIFINQTKPPESVWNEVIDLWVGMDCDAWVHDLHQRRSDLWHRQGTLQLPVIKKVSGIGKKKPQVQSSHLEDLKLNKKSLNIRSEHGTFETDLPTDMDKENTERLNSYQVQGVQSWKKDTRSVARKTSGNTFTEINPLRPFKNGISKTSVPKTPSKRLAKLAASAHLLTPPSSERRFVGKRIGPDDLLKTSWNQDELVNSPSKRSKDKVEIWVDVTDDQGRISGTKKAACPTEEVRWMAFPRRMEMNVSQS